MSSTRPLPPRPSDLDITIVSAKHLKNVNWRTGSLKPYAIFWIDPDRRLATKSDDSGSTRPVWNEQFLLPLSLPPNDTVLTLEIFHSKPLESSKPLVALLRLPLKDLVDPDDSTRLRTFELRRPSGRPHGKIKLKLSIRERPLPPIPDYHNTPHFSHYYTSAPPLPRLSPPPPLPNYTYGGPYSDPYANYYSAPAPSPPPPAPPSSSSGYYAPVRPYYGGPSAPADYGVGPGYEQKVGARSGKMGLAVGALAGLALEEGIKYEGDKIGERVESGILAPRDDYRDYRSEY